MDKAKLRLFAGIAGALFGFCGLVALAVAGSIALAAAIGLGPAVAVLAGAFLLLAIMCFSFFLLPTKSIEEEIHQAEELGSAALADLPFDTLKQFIKKHPLSATAIALTVGYSLIKNPQGLAKQAQRAMIHVM